ncbi:MAG: beta-lactamase family protein [Chloroflexi bacterium]|nr:beta-lactamase family protein [Chloroflexota bacterium]MYF21626.1 beta-lactamase family protein [Chloroflexota bacterium]
MTSINQDKLNDLFDYVEGIVSEEKVPAAQIAIGHDGELVGMRTFGKAHNGTSVEPASDDTLFCMFSATKAIVGVGVWKLLDEGLLDLDERVVDIIPGWCAEGGGDASYVDVTVRQVMLHTGGFPFAPMNPRLWEDRDARLRRMMGWRLNWTPDSQFEYHATSAHWVLAEIIQQKTGKDFRDWLRANLLDPMGLDNLYVGLPNEEHDRAAGIVYTEEPLPVAGGEVFPQTILHFNLASQRRAGCPGGGAFANAADVAMFYQGLVKPADDGPLSANAIELGTTVGTNPDRHVDLLSGIHVNRALTVVLAGDDGLTAERGFGRGASPRAFGHAGAGGQIAWGDPETGLSVGFLTNGFQQDENVYARTHTIGTMAAACVE